MEQERNIHKVVKGMSSQTMVTLVLGLVEILSFSIMSRLLTQQDFGYYAVISAITAVFASFSESGIGSAIVQQKELSKHFVDNAFTLAFTLGVLMFLLLLFLSEPLSRLIADESMKVPLMLMSGTLFLNSLSSVNFSIMHRKMQFLRMGGINLGSLVITTTVALLLAWKGFGYYAIITQAILGSVITYILSLYFSKTHFSFVIDKNTFKKIFSFGGWLMASSLFRHLAHQIDRLMMPHLLSVSSLGAYNRPKNFIESISGRLNGIFDSTLFPVLSGLQDNRRALNGAFCRSMYMMNVFASLLTMFFFFNSGLIIRVFFGEQWANLKLVMMIISLSLLFNIDGRLADCYLRSLALTKQQFYFRIFETLLKTMGIIIGFRWDIVGVALSVVITNFITKMVKILYVGKKIDVKVGSCISIIVSSWRYALVIIPISSAFLLLLPRTWVGDICMTAVFGLCVGAIFIFFPGIVGKQYKEDVHERIMLMISKKLKRK